jgi:hypothetical protein
VFCDEFKKAGEIQNRIDEHKREEEMKHKNIFYGQY